MQVGDRHLTRVLQTSGHKNSVPVKKIRRISTRLFFFLLFFVHRMLSFHLKLFSHRDGQALEQSSQGVQCDVQTADENMGTLGNPAPPDPYAR